MILKTTASTTINSDVFYSLTNLLPMFDLYIELTETIAIQQKYSQFSEMFAAQKMFNVQIKHLLFREDMHYSKEYTCIV